MLLSKVHPPSPPKRRVLCRTAKLLLKKGAALDVPAARSSPTPTMPRHSSRRPRRRSATPRRRSAAPWRTTTLGARRSSPSASPPFSFSIPHFFVFIFNSDAARRRALSSGTNVSKHRISTKVAGCTIFCESNHVAIQ